MRIPSVLGLNLLKETVSSVAGDAPGLSLESGRADRMGCEETRRSVPGKERQNQHRGTEERKSARESYIFQSCADGTPWPRSGGG